MLFVLLHISLIFPAGRRFFFFNDTATTEIYTLSLHDALPISRAAPSAARKDLQGCRRRHRQGAEDRKSTRLNSSHSQISYAVFCLKKKGPAATLQGARASAQGAPRREGDGGR